jgi:hypothetical protein
MVLHRVEEEEGMSDENENRPDFGDIVILVLWLPAIALGAWFLNWSMGGWPMAFLASLWGG